MTPEQITLVRESWMRVSPIGEQAMTLFYQRLFEIAPESEALFQDTDMPAQRWKLLEAISLAVKSLKELPSLTPVLHDLGARHAGYGVEEHHYDAVGAALLSTLATGLADEWTPPVADAWTAVYGQVATAMKEGAPRQRAIA